MKVRPIPAPNQRRRPIIAKRHRALHPTDSAPSDYPPTILRKWDIRIAVQLSRGNGTMPMQRIRITHLSALAALMIVAGVAYWTSPSSAQIARGLPPPAVDETTGASREVTVLAGGCFWGVQGVFQHVDGGISAVC